MTKADISSMEGSAKATHPSVFEAYFLNVCIPKNERDHWAGREILSLREAIDEVIEHASALGLMRVTDNDERMEGSEPSPLLRLLWALRHAQFVRRVVPSPQTQAEARP